MSDYSIDPTGIPTERSAPLTSEYADPELDAAAYRERVYREAGQSEVEAKRAAMLEDNRRARAMGETPPHSVKAITDLLRAAVAAAPAGDLD
jgi:hypothetical protein